MSDTFLQNVKFLVVDDNAFMRNIVRRVLNIFGAYQFSEASDGAEALKVLKNFQPDIIIVDWEMEPVDGIELVKMLRTGEESLNVFVPIIMLSGHSETSRVTVARDCGVNEFVVKPFSANSLLNRIEAVIVRPWAFVRSAIYFGPDRRRRDLGFAGDERRGVAPPEEAPPEEAPPPADDDAAKQEAQETPTEETEKSDDQESGGGEEGDGEKGGDDAAKSEEASAGGGEEGDGDAAESEDDDTASSGG